jgi:sphingomyelin phosphodiesterase
MDLKYVSGAST